MNRLVTLLSCLFGYMFLALSALVTTETISRKLFNFSFQGPKSWARGYTAETVLPWHERSLALRHLFPPVSIFIVLMCELGLITPPVGMNLYVVQGVRQDRAIEQPAR